MALDEAMRHRIHGRLEELLGTDEAAALMSALPSEDRLAQRIDRLGEQLVQRIDGVEQRLDTKIDGVEQRLEAKIDGVEQRLEAKIDGVEQRLDTKIDGVEERLTLRIDVAVERARAETSREARHALLASFGVLAAVATAVLSAIGFFS